MITDFQANFVYFSDILNSEAKYAQLLENLSTALADSKVNFAFLSDTRDIWARDYMPIQVAIDNFVEYRYDPDYLQGKKYRNNKSYPDYVCHKNGIETKKCDLILDGGNVIKSSDCIILTDKLVAENKSEYSKSALIAKIKDLFEVDKVVLIPWDKENDYLGHADGMVRFIDDNTILTQGYFERYPEKFKDQFFDVLTKNSLSWKCLSLEVEHPDERNWAYLNFLQTKDLILVPSLGIDEDQLALDQIKAHFPAYSSDRVKQIDMTDIVAEGGALNCISWSVAL